MSSEPVHDSPQQRRWYQRIGPGLITACVVIGPGSILTSSNVGARYGYGLSWVVVVSVFFMLIYMSMGARLGVSVGMSSGSLIADRIGRWMAVLIGISVFFISAAFQFGNNLGVHYALATYFDFDYLVVIFNGLAIAFLLAFKNMYRALEKLMMVFVGVMLVAFACNLLIAGPRLGEWLVGFVPSGSQFDLSVLGLVGTTFVTSAAFFQSYLVRQKGWSKKELRQGMIDVRVGAVIMALITLMLMATPATVFHPDFRHQRVVTAAGSSELTPNRTLVVDDADPVEFRRVWEAAAAETIQPEGATVAEPKWSAMLPASDFQERFDGLASPPTTSPRGFAGLPEVGLSLKPLFGGLGPHLFFLGVFAAAYSSFLVNSMIGGFILADGLGIGDRPQDTWPKVFTIGVLLTGMFVGLYCITVLKGARPVTLIVAAQAVTVLASPLVAGAILWLTSRKDIMGENVNGPILKLFGVIGFLLLLAMSANLAITRIIPALQGMLG